jgi:large subunit ribosomal protein L25
MEAIYLEAAVREEAEIGKSPALRQKGFVPCVVYGEGKKTLSLKIERSRLTKFLHAHHGGENMVITLKVAGSGARKADERPVLIKEVQVHPVHDEILHIDFNEVSLTKRIIVKVPLHAVGEPVGVKLDGGTLEHIMWEIDVECLPTQIPEKIDINVEPMKIGDTVHVKDLVIPEGVTIKHDLESIVLNVVPPHKEDLVTPEAAAAAEGAAATEPEVIKKEKKPVEGEEEEAAKPEAKKPEGK